MTTLPTYEEEQRHHPIAPQVSVRAAVWLASIGWAGLILYEILHGDVQPPVWTGAVGASITLAVAFSTRVQARRQTVLDVHREYYSHEFAEQRRLATRFFKRYATEEWSKSPYELPDPENTRQGYSNVLRFWHRVAVLYINGALDRSLCERLLSREFAYWHAFIFSQLTGQRRDMYTKDLLLALNRRLRLGEDVRAYNEGWREGLAARPATATRRWYRKEKRWTTKAPAMAGN